MAPISVIACGFVSSASGSHRQSAAPPALSAPAAVVGAPTADSGAQLSCRVPVAGFNPGTGGFVNFPGGRFTADPGSNVPLPANTVTTGAYMYDRAFSRWLPVARDWVSPDGTHYAFSDRDGAVHVVDVATGSDRQLVGSTGTLDPARRWTVLDYENDAVYLGASPRQGGFPSGLWAVDLARGNVRQLSDHGFWQIVNGEAAWGSPDMGGAASAGAAATLLRVDLKSGATSTWFDAGEGQLVLLGVDTQGPLVMITKAQETEAWLVSAPGSARKVYSGPSQDVPGSLRVSGTGVRDAHGLWLGSPDGLLLFVQGAEFKRMSSAGGWVGGPCL
jgi:hypothetical protein